MYLFDLVFGTQLALEDLSTQGSYLWNYYLERGVEPLSFFLLVGYAYIYVNAFQFWFNSSIYFIAIFTMISDMILALVTNIVWLLFMNYGMSLY